MTKNESAKKYRENHPEKVRQSYRKWREANPEKAKESAKRTREKYREARKEYSRIYHKEHRDELLEKGRMRRLLNPEKYREKSKNWMINNPEKYLETKKKSIKKNHLKLMAGHSKYCKTRRDTDPIFKLITNIRTRINRAITRESKYGRTMDLLGCTIVELKKHIESQFLPGMSWENWGLYTWHIDHKKPIASFDISDPEQQKICFHFSNLQPMWAKDNLMKRWDKEDILPV